MIFGLFLYWLNTTYIVVTQACSHTTKAIKYLLGVLNFLWIILGTAITLVFIVIIKFIMCLINFQLIIFRIDPKLLSCNFVFGASRLLRFNILSQDKTTTFNFTDFFHVVFALKCDLTFLLLVGLHSCL